MIGRRALRKPGEAEDDWPAADRRVPAGARCLCCGEFCGLETRGIYSKWTCEECGLSWMPETSEEHCKMSYSLPESAEWHDVPAGCMAVFGGA